MFKPPAPSLAACPAHHGKAPAAACPPRDAQPSLLRARFSAELTRMLAQLVTLR